MSQQTSGNVSRRRFVVGAGTIGVAGLAGCTANTDDGNGDGDGNGGGNGDGGGNGGGNGDNGGGSLSGEISITGSSTVYPVTTAMAEEFKRQHPDVTLSIESTGSGGGFENYFCTGDSDINGASRPITDEEVESCESNDVNPVEFQIASDALTVAVNNEADWVDCLSYDQLRQIWKSDGAETWADVDPDWPDEEFDLYGPASTSGTFDWFTENVNGEVGNIRGDYEPSEDDNTLVQGIQGSEYAMGFFGYAYYAENEDSIKAVDIKKEQDGECTTPSLANAKDGSYPMARPLFIYPNEEAMGNEHVAEFLRFYFENANTDLVEQVGYVPASEELTEENLSTLEEYTG